MSADHKPTISIPSAFVPAAEPIPLLTGVFFPSEQAGTPFEAIAVPFEGQLIDYVSMGRAELSIAMEKAHDSPSAEVSDDFFNVSFEDLFKVPVSEGENELNYVEILQHNSGGIETAIRNTDFVAEQIASGEATMLSVISVKQEIAQFVAAPPPVPEVQAATVIPAAFVEAPKFEYAVQGNLFDTVTPANPGPLGMMFQLVDIIVSFSPFTVVPVMGGVVSTDLAFTDPDMILNHITASINGDFAYVQGWDGPHDSATQFLFYELVDGFGTGIASALMLVPPVVLDLDGNGIHLVSAQDSHMTLGALTGTQSTAKVGWFGEGDGMLMWNKYGDGQYHNLSQIDFAGYTPGAKTDLQGLVAFDTDHNGVLNAQDKDFSQFGVLLSDGSYKSLVQLHITSLSLISDNHASVQNGNIINGMTTFQYANGVQHAAADAALVIPLKISEVISLEPPVDHPLAQLAAPSPAAATPAPATPVSAEPAAAAAPPVAAVVAHETLQAPVPVVHESHGG